MNQIVTRQANHFQVSAKYRIASPFEIDELKSISTLVVFPDPATLKSYVLLRLPEGETVAVPLAFLEKMSQREKAAS